jgi:hypothetical protein
LHADTGTIPAATVSDYWQDFKRQLIVKYSEGWWLKGIFFNESLACSLQDKIT